MAKPKRSWTGRSFTEESMAKESKTGDRLRTLEERVQSLQQQVDDLKRKPPFPNVVINA